MTSVSIDRVPGRVEAMVFSHTSRQLVVAKNDAAVYLWTLDALNQGPALFPLSREYSTALNGVKVAFDARGHWLISQGDSVRACH